MPAAPGIIDAAASKPSLVALVPSIETITSPGLIPAWRAGPCSEEVTIRPSSAGLTVRPTP